MPTQFEPVLTNNGFDKDVTPRWQVVPVSGFKRVRLTDAAGLTLNTLSPGIATVAEAPNSKPADRNRDFLITGKTTGTAFIEAVDPVRRMVVARLEVSVKPRKTVKLAFNYVEDNAGHKTSRVAGGEDAWIDEMNKIYLPQTNIKFEKQSVRNVRVDQNLRRVVRYSKHLPGVAARQHEWDVVVAKGDATADLNYFFVWEYEQDRTPHVDHANAGTLGGNCIFEDDLGGKPTEEVLAHEAGHFLGVDDFYEDARRHWVMHGSATVGRLYIPKEHVNIMNP